MKETIAKDERKLLSPVKSYFLRFVFVKVVYFIITLLVSRGCILGSYYPFGLSFCASVPTGNLTSSLIGAILGYLFPLRLGSGIRYISATLSIGAIRWALNDLTKVKNHILYAPMVAFVSSFVTGLAINCADGLDKHGIMITLLECFVAAVSSYLFDVTFKLISSKKIYGLTVKEFTYFALTLSILLLSLSGVSFHNISLGRIFGIITTLIAAYSIGTIGGTIMGTSSGLILSLPSLGLVFLPGSYAFSGMISGMFSSFGRWGVSMAFLSSYFLIFFRSVDVFQMVSGLYELLIAIIIFFFLPESLFKSVKYSFSSSTSVENYDFVCRSLTKRLKILSKCLSSAKGCVDRTTAEIRNVSPLNCNEACMDAVKAYCSECGVKRFCWSQNYKSTYYEIQNIIREMPNVSQANLSHGRLKYCRSMHNIVKRIDSVKRDFSERELLNFQAKELKKAVGEHFSEISLILNDISRDFQDYKPMEWELHSKVEKLLTSAGMGETNVSCRQNSDNRVLIEIELDTSKKEKFNSKLLKSISTVLGKKFDKPSVSFIGSKCRIRLSEEKKYKISFSVSQHVCNGGKVCGDSCRCFEDETGKFNIVLSDGMGTGSSAAVGGTLVSELMKEFLKSGVNFDTAIRLVNSALLLNSREESLIALDILSIDLFNGKAKLVKAGSPATYIVREKEVKRLDFSSLPLGILNEVSFSHENINLMSGDWIILLSDGVTDIGEEWITNLLGEIDYNTVSEVSKYIVDKAVKARISTHDDDITAIALKIFS